MLLYGNSLNIQPRCKVFNISSLYEGVNCEYLKLLTPPVGTMVTTGDRQFDINYYNYIMLNDPVFVQFFTIIYNLYLGIDVYLLVGDEDWQENLIEALLKVIQQRYGYNAIKINCEEDMFMAMSSNQDFDKCFGLYNLDMDKARYIALTGIDKMSEGDFYE